MPTIATLSHTIERVTAGGAARVDDTIAVEEPLEIRAVIAGAEYRVTVTMRTPGADAELAVGFLMAERIVGEPREVLAVRPCLTQSNLIRVELTEECAPRVAGVARNFVATSSCGLCGKTSLESVFASIPEPLALNGSAVAGDALQQIPARLRSAQSVFDRTGGLHAVAAFTFDGELVALYEDVGRHNAFDKLVGAAALAGGPDMDRCVVALSGRAGFELVQKAAVAGVPVIAAIGAPSSLAVELAERAGITLVGFLRASGFNIYTHAGRVAVETRSQAEV
ncbi:MAG TPA: formate dehydrogenase accessory sulfurtransferase FdhD [Steroidobacteraceae bacterium]|nr:formate dehydrogenase accessory sulfurtransferase FdhD [Steroidobacteraceae bacterium]